MHQGISNLIVKSDFLLVVEDILQQEAPSSAIGNILIDIKELMLRFTNCTVQYGNCIGNVAAH